MNRVIYKFRFDDDLMLTLSLAQPVLLHLGPADSEVDPMPAVWVEHDVDARPDTVITLLCVSTGQTPPMPPMEHFASCRCGLYMWHAYQFGALA